MEFSAKESIPRLVVSVSVALSTVVLFTQPAVYADPIPKGW